MFSPKQRPGPSEPLNILAGNDEPTIGILALFADESGDAINFLAVFHIMRRTCRGSRRGAITLERRASASAVILA